MQICLTRTDNMPQGLRVLNILTRTVYSHITGIKDNLHKVPSLFRSFGFKYGNKVNSLNALLMLLLSSPIGVNEECRLRRFFFNDIAWTSTKQSSAILIKLPIATSIKYLNHLIYTTILLKIQNGTKMVYNYSHLLNFPYSTMVRIRWYFQTRRVKRVRWKTLHKSFFHSF